MSDKRKKENFNSHSIKNSAVKVNPLTGKQECKYITEIDPATLFVSHPLSWKILDFIISQEKYDNIDTIKLSKSRFHLWTKNNGSKRYISREDVSRRKYSACIINKYMKLDPTRKFSLDYRPIYIRQMEHTMHSEKIKKRKEILSILLDDGNNLKRCAEIMELSYGTILNYYKQMSEKKDGEKEEDRNI